jgi:hypothetical protein
MAERVDKPELVQRVARRLDRDGETVAEIVDGFLEEIYAAVKGGDSVSLLRDMLNGDEQAHDRDDAGGAICRVDYQALPDRPINSFVTLLGLNRARAIAAGPPRKGRPRSPKGGIGVATRR